MGLAAGQPNHDLENPVRGDGRLDRAVEPFDHGFAERQAESAVSCIRLAAGRITSPESIEHAVSVMWGQVAARIADRQLDAGVLKMPRDPDGALAVGVRHGVIQDVLQNEPQLVGIAFDRLDCVQAPFDAQSSRVGLLFKRLPAVADNLCDVDWFAPNFKLACVGACQMEEVLSHTLHLEVDLQAIVHGFSVCRRRTIARQCELERGAKAGQRRPQFVGYIARKPPLALKRGFKSGQLIVKTDGHGRNLSWHHDRVN